MGSENRIQMVTQMEQSSIDTHFSSSFKVYLLIFVPSNNSCYILFLKKLFDKIKHSSKQISSIILTNMHKKTRQMKPHHHQFLFPFHKLYYITYNNKKNFINFTFSSSFISLFQYFSKLKQ